MPFARSGFDDAGTLVNESSAVPAASVVPVAVNGAAPDESSAAAVTSAAEVVWTPTVVTSTAESAVATKAGIIFNVHPFRPETPSAHFIDARKAPEVRSPLTHSAGWVKERGIATR